MPVLMLCFPFSAAPAGPGKSELWSRAARQVAEMERYKPGETDFQFTVTVGRKTVMENQGQLIQFLENGTVYSRMVMEEPRKSSRRDRRDDNVPETWFSPFSEESAATLELGELSQTSLEGRSCFLMKLSWKDPEEGVYEGELWISEESFAPVRLRIYGQPGVKRIVDFNTVVYYRESGGQVFPRRQELNSVFRQGLIRGVYSSAMEFSAFFEVPEGAPEVMLSAF